jgi:menaquinone-dependent protoporphyrinogen oxidase
VAEEISRRKFVAIGGAAIGVAALGGAGFAATVRPTVAQRHTRIGAGMSSILVVFGTKSGCTQGVAEKIGATLADAGATVDVVPAADAPDPTAFDAVVVGSGVRMSQWHEPARSWVAAHADVLKSKPVAFYTVGLILAQSPEKVAEVRAYTDPLVERTGVKPVDIGLFAGWNEPKHFSFIECIILKAMKAPAGDKRDWSAIEAWARATAPMLAV